MMLKTANLLAAAALAAVFAGPAPAIAAKTAGDKPMEATAKRDLVRVTAGDSGATSRVAFNFTPHNGFRVEQTGRQVTVLFPDAHLRFAYEQVYPRRQASRVTFAGPADRPNASAFTLRFACNCEASVALDDAQRVLVEVRDKDAMAAPQGDAPAAEPAMSVDGGTKEAMNAAEAGHTAVDHATTDGGGQHQADQVDQPSLTPVYSKGRPRARPANRRASDGKVMNDDAGDHATHQGASDGGHTATDHATHQAEEGFQPPEGGTLAAHEIDRLRQSLEWAANQGYIDKKSNSQEAGGRVPDGSPPPPNITNLQTPEDRALADKQAMAAAEPEPEDPDKDVPVDDKVALKDGPPTHALPLDETEWNCTGEPKAPLIEWAKIKSHGADYLRAIGAQRTEVVELEGDAAMRSMALFYLKHGLTIEALSTVNVMEDRDEGLREVILVLLGRGDEGKGAVLMADPCMEDIGLWRAGLLKMHGYRELAEHTAAGAIEQLKYLPPYPRTILALQLAEAALNRDNAELGDRFLDHVEPAPGQMVADQVAVLRGRIALLKGHKERADWYFSQAIESGTDGRRRARVAIIRHALANNEPMPRWAQDAMRSALFDYRGHRRLLPLALLAADIHAAAGDFAFGLEELLGAADRLPETVDQTPVEEKAREVLSKAIVPADAVDDQTALQLYTDYQRFVGEDPVSKAIRKRLADRMMAAGLPSVAARVLEPLTQSAVTKPAVKLDYAAAQLRSGRPAETIRTLDRVGLQSARANAMRERALIQIGRYDAAADLAAAASPNPKEAAREKARLLWAAGDWNETFSAYQTALQDMDPKAPPPEAGDIALKALASAYMIGGVERLGPLYDRAMQLAQAAGMEKAAAALANDPVPDNLTLPDTVAAVLERSNQVGALFTAAPGNGS